MFLLFLLLLVLGAGVSVRSVAARQMVNSFVQYDGNGDEKPDYAVIRCSCVSEEDTILVYDGAADMVASDDWQTGTDTRNDTWVIDIQSDGDANLIVVFEGDGQQVVARLFDDVNGDGRVGFSVNDVGQVVVDESPFWSLEVTALEGWWLADGTVNLNISALIDKDAHNDFPGLATRPDLDGWLAQDGEPDMAFEMRDRDEDGIPEYAVTNLLADIPERYGVGRSKLWVNSGGTATSVPETALFWPFLDFEPKSANRSDNLRYFDYPPRVKIDWQTSQITGFILPGYPTGEGYHLNNLQNLSREGVNYPDFEAPHAYYDLANNGDGFPELNVRLFYGYRPSNHPWLEVRYSWNQHNPGTLIWDYKVGLLGRHPDEDKKKVDIGGYVIKMIPYAEIPHWVLDREWLLTTFVAREHGAQWTSEGIYDWTPWAGANPRNQPVDHVAANEAAFRYASGASDRSPEQYLNVISPGYRGEYAYAASMKTELYLSNIDRRLHLANAEGGLLAVDEHLAVEYENLNQDEYLDAWHKVKDGAVVASLYYSPPYLFYSRTDSLIIKKIDVEESLFTTLPPRSHAEWESLGERLALKEAAFAAYEFDEMLRALEGPTMTLTGASMANFRLLPSSGSRFELTLAPGFTIRGADLFHLAPQLSSGDYVVRGTDTLHLIPAGPAELRAGINVAASTDPHLMPSYRVRFVVDNLGASDLTDGRLFVSFVHTGSVVQREARALHVLAEDQTSVPIDWKPDRSGEWVIKAEIVANERRVGTAERKVLVQDAEQNALPSSVVRGLRSAAPLLAIVAVAVSVIVGSVVYVSVYPGAGGDR